jgi:hypothetical protein
MSSRTPNITPLTSDYDAIERAIRETARGRWFLNCYLERNRSSETKMLLEAIARLEGAMRDNGHMVEALAPVEALSRAASAIGEARADIARMGTEDGDTVPLPTQRFSFGGIPRAAMATAEAIRDAAHSVEDAASTLRGAGVFRGVAAKITSKADEILRACAVQVQAIRRMECLAEAMSEVEAEIMAAMDGRYAEPDDAYSAVVHRIHGDADPRSLTIPEMVMEELSQALSGSSVVLDSDLPGEPA